MSLAKCLTAALICIAAGFLQDAQLCYAVHLPLRSLQGVESTVIANASLPVDRQYVSGSANSTQNVSRESEAHKIEEELGKRKGDAIAAATFGAIILLSIAGCFAWCLYKRYRSKGPSSNDIEVAAYLKRKAETRKYEKYNGDDEL